MATVQAANYFNYINTLPGTTNQFYVGDQIYCVCSDGNVELQVTAVGFPLGSAVTTAFPNADIAPGSITTAMLGANIVTAAKIANGAVTTTQIASNAGIVGTQLANNTVGAAQLALNTIQYAQVAMTVSQWNLMFATPFQILAAPGAGLQNMIYGFTVDVAYGGTPIAGGGPVGLAFGSTLHLGSPAASSTILAAAFTGLSANGTAGAAGANGGSANNTATYISNSSGAFTGGTASTFNVNVWYATYAV
jgi:hypothetical protein